ncbi:hypothetical protein COW36_11300 [bacterium (Candidatus Blackallbacteria) CG17_big_fil_post_rev_8_21_14_2_50_48_46]|uniref:Serine aminopeptidase S33 domain-containing protein n=1 Tax=bacterium (Candidatus Blackallbacteria) CG17_big_fil_post_rev_8_21_14_2_50_48_46 TaxID=2014261 RepID=A0A2M7G4Z8_9BACT|nr:MAG: hypothetical protein COW64_18395 [bacterium (Candidatus Blackallbacteria) CG18_big_fil_WC_8_21_14_2_50_49_26]PIW16861.1 MAG: hypothetical protein COW36_11300 [bacterium (Candidatus Blackallbacteria) CG17_big_fil_post_rev_8_21_14_2_50_48_46]PIW48058.1 MAG: hypothetical protein COW20_11015 [bacterium (Candidatus Blackallbacteria) CG13_big_fil_rev_8_21_14_2_50_49_14]
MGIVHEVCDQIAPALWVYAEDREQASHKGAVFFYHGLGSAKEQSLKELESLAAHGFLAIGIDNRGHGARRYADFEARFSGENPDFGSELIAAVRATAAELPHLIDAYLAEGWIQPEKLGLVGVSMGGYIAYAAILAEPRLKAVSVILGSPYWRESPAESPAHRPERFFPCALLSQNAGQDQAVPAQFARDFHQALQTYYAQAPERLAYFEYPESGHFMREEDWDLCWQRSISWFENNL